MPDHIEHFPPLRPHTYLFRLTTLLRFSSADLALYRAAGAAHQRAQICQQSFAMVVMADREADRAFSVLSDRDRQVVRQLQRPNVLIAPDH